MWVLEMRFTPLCWVGDSGGCISKVAVAQALSTSILQAKRQGPFPALDMLLLHHVVRYDVEEC
jgi:hypothetical protein